MTTLDLNGTWVLTKNVSMDKYLAEVGVPYLVRVMILKLTPILTIAHDAQTFKIETKSAGSSSSVSFKLGEEFKEVTGKGGKETRSVAAAEPDRLVMQSVTDDVEEERSLQINQKGELVQRYRMKNKDLVAERIYKRA